MPDWRPEIRSKLAALRLGAEREMEIVEELSQHLDDRCRQLVSVGRTEQKATDEARGELGTTEELGRAISTGRTPDPARPPATRSAGAGAVDCRAVGRPSPINSRSVPDPDFHSGRRSDDGADHRPDNRLLEHRQLARLAACPGGVGRRSRGHGLVRTLAERRPKRESESHLTLEHRRHGLGVEDDPVSCRHPGRSRSRRSGGTHGGEHPRRARGRKPLPDTRHQTIGWPLLHSGRGSAALRRRGRRHQRRSRPKRPSGHRTPRWARRYC